MGVGQWGVTGRYRREVRGVLGGIQIGGLIRNLATMGENTRREWGNIWKITNKLYLRLPLKSGHKKVSGPQWNEVFVRGGGLWKTFVSMESQWSGGEVVSCKGHCCCQIGLSNGRGRRGRTKL